MKTTAALFAMLSFATLFLHAQVQFDDGTAYQVGNIVDGLVSQADNNTSADVLYGQNDIGIPYLRPAFYVKYLPNNGSGTMGSSVTAITFSSQSADYYLKDMAVGNFDGTTYRDLALLYTDNGTNKLTVYKYTASGFQSPFVTTLPAGTIKMMAIGNINGVAMDNPTVELEDIAIAINNVVYIYTNNTSGGFLSFGIYNFGTQAYDPNYVIDNTKLGGHHNLNTIRGIGFVDYQKYGGEPFYDDLVIVDDGMGTETRHIDNRIFNNPNPSTHWLESSFGSIESSYDIGMRIDGADLNNDGFEELSFDGGVKDGVTKSLVWTASHFKRHVVLADVDCDGKTDIAPAWLWLIPGIPSSSGTNIGIHYNDGPSGYPDNTVDLDLPALNTMDLRSYVMEDIQGNGSRSIMAISYYGDVKIFKRLDNAPPSKPVLVYVGKNTPTSNLIRVSWKANPELDVTGYEVWRGFSTSPSVPPTTWSLKAAVGGTSWIEDDFIIGGSWAHNYAHYRIKAQDSQNQLSAVSNSMAVAVGAMLPKTAGEEGHRHQFLLAQNSPNPFNPTTRISYEIPEAGHVTLKIFNAVGQHVATLVNDYQEAGAKEITWNGKDDSGNEVASGLYLYRLQAGDQIKTMKMNLLK